MKIGDRFGKLVVQQLIAGQWQGKRKNIKPSTARVFCDCGNETVVRRGSLTSGRTSSCGCIRRELAAAKGQHAPN